MNNKILEQVNSIKYLGIIFDSKLTFRDHVNYIEEKCRKLIFTLSKSAKVRRGLKHEALKTVYTGGILPLILYGAPVWKSVLDNTSYKAKIIRIQRLINIRIAKAYRTVSSDALCVITGIIPINIKIEEIAKYYECIKGNGNLIDREMEVKHWTHPANSVKIIEELVLENETNEHTIQIFTDGSKNEHGVGSGTAIYKQNKLTHQMKHKLHDKCSNNQAEQMAIVKALQAIETIKINNNIPRTIKIHTDSRITLESLKNMKNQNHLIEEIRN